MPRISAEARAAAAFRAGQAPPEPPKDLGAAASAVWRRIVADRPVDWFRPGSEELLGQFCRSVVEAKKIARELRRLSPLDAEYEKMLKFHQSATALMNITAQRLRLTVQNDVNWHSRKLNEYGSGANAPAGLSRLLGGKAKLVVA